MANADDVARCREDNLSQEMRWAVEGIGDTRVRVEKMCVDGC